MIKSLKLYNFQTHRELSLEFSPGITTIKGPTDAGKSAVLRALRWLCLNDLAGDDFVSWGRKEAVAVLDLLYGGPEGDAAMRVVRRKGKENIYKLNGEVFKAFGASKVPELIEEVLGVNEINFQKQHDSPFWLSASAPEVSRQLNRVIDLSVIDQSMSKAGAFLRTARERVTVSEERLKTKTEQLEAAVLSKKRIAAFSRLKAAFDAHSELEKNHTDLFVISDRLATVAQKRVRIEARRNSLEVILVEAGRLRKAEATIQKLSSLAAQLEALDLRPLPDFGPLSAAWHKVSAAESLRGYLMSLTAQMAEAEGAERAKEELLSDLRSRLEKVACPTCGSKKKP